MTKPGKQCAIFSHNGIGDGINLLTLSHNLFLGGWSVDTYHNTLSSLQNWFPHLPILPYPEVEQVEAMLQKYDLLCIVHNDTYPFPLELTKLGKALCPSKIKVLYLYPSPRIRNEPYYQDCLVDPNLSVRDNLLAFCTNILHCPSQSPHNGISPPSSLSFRKHPKRLLVHPTSAKPSRCWPKEKFLKLASSLQKMGFSPVFIPGEDPSWDNIPFPVEKFSTLDALASYIFESGYLLGNDSGLGHLASALSLPTLTICRRPAQARLWAPSFAPNIAITPSPWIPNIRGLRLRDRHWKRWISSRKILEGFCQLQKM